MLQDAAPAATGTTPPAPPPVDVTPSKPIESIGDAVDQATASVSRMSEVAWNYAVQYGPRILGVLILLFIAWILAGWARAMVRRALLRAKVEITLTKFIANSTRWVILVFAVIACLGTFGVNTTSFAAIIGAAGLAVGLALQGNLSNLASGILLLVFRPFKVGDTVIVAGQTGVIDGIDLFTTNLDTADNRRIIVPNGAIFSGVIENQTRHAFRRIDFTLGTAGSADITQTRALLEGVVARVLKAGVGAVSDPAPKITLQDLTPAVMWTINLWAETPKVGAVRELLLTEIKRSIDEAKIAPPGPSMDIRMHQPAVALTQGSPNATMAGAPKN